MSTHDTQLWRFPGGLRLRPNKKRSLEHPILEVPVPPRLTVPIQQHIGVKAEPIVTIGQKVLKGQRIAEPKGYVSASIHAPSSGVVTAIGEYPVPHVSGSVSTCIVIDTDGHDESHPDCVREPFEKLDALEMRKRIRQLGIVGLGGATFPTDVKLNVGPHLNIEALILNGAECEPYIACDNALMREQANKVISGAQILMQALATPRCLIAVENHMTAAADALVDALQNTDDRISIIRVPSVYPEGGERQLIQVLSGKEVPFDGLPIDIGFICQNIATAVAAHDAFCEGMPLISRIVTVTGEGVTQPRNLRARVGTPLKDLIRLCDGVTDSADRLIIGGPMMGYTINNDELPVTKATNCLFIPERNRVNTEYAEMPCIRCGECAQVCPAQLLPQQLYWHAKSGHFPKTEEYGLFDCIECGCCAYVCPSHIPLVQYYRYAKTEIWSQQKQKSRAHAAKQRFETREHRLEQARADKLHKNATRQPKTATITQAHAKRTIAEVMHRVEAAESAKPEADDLD